MLCLYYLNRKNPDILNTNFKCEIIVSESDSENEQK